MVAMVVEPVPADIVVVVDAVTVTACGCKFARGIYRNEHFQFRSHKQLGKRKLLSLRK